jgi:hypothetical protein
MFYPNYLNFMPNYGQTVNPYNPLSQENTIQTIKQNNPSVNCYFVNDKAEMQGINVMPGTVYIGINKKSNEVYIRSWNNDGNIDFNTFSKIENNQEVSETKQILQRLDKIEEKLNERSVANGVKSNDERSVRKQSDDECVQANDARKNKRTADTNLA